MSLYKWNSAEWMAVATRGTSGDQVWNLIYDLVYLENLCREAEETGDMSKVLEHINREVAPSFL